MFDAYSNWYSYSTRAKAFLTKLSGKIFPPKGRKLGFVQSVSAADGHSSDSRLDPDSYPFFHLFLRIFGNAIALLTLCNYWMRLPCHSRVNWVADSCYSVWNLAIVYLRIDGMMLCSHLLYLGCYRMRSLGSTPPSGKAKLRHIY